MTKRKILYGYQIRGGALEIVPEEQRVVQMLFALYSAGASYQDISDALNRQGVPYSSEIPLWNKHKIKRMLENARYTGKDGYPVMIAETDFQAVQDKISEKNDRRQVSEEVTVVDRLKPYFRCTCGGKMVRLGGRWQDRSKVYGGLFCLAVAMVLRLVPYVLGLTVIVLALWFLDRHALKTVDWGLLATFAAFFTFSGNLARMEAVHILFARLLSHGTILISALTCQIISNVPAAILLSRFTQDACGLLVGVNVGGAGTLVASLASLITFREYTHHVPNGGKQFLFLFSGISFAFLTILLAAMSFLNG